MAASNGYSSIPCRLPSGFLKIKKSRHCVGIKSKDRQGIWVELENRIEAKPKLYVEKTAKYQLKCSLLAGKGALELLIRNQ